MFISITCMARGDTSVRGQAVSVYQPLFKEPQQKKAANMLIGRSQAMRDVAETVRQVAAHRDTTVLLQGESGTGKDVVAHAIHALSSRADYQFVISTVLPFLIPCWKLNSLVSRLEPSLMQKSRVWATCCAPTRGRCSWMRSARCPSFCNLSSCASWRRLAFAVLVASRRLRSICASSPPPIPTSSLLSGVGPSGKICTTGLKSLRY